MNLTMYKNMEVCVISDSVDVKLGILFAWIVKKYVGIMLSKGVRNVCLLRIMGIFGLLWRELGKLSNRFMMSICKIRRGDTL